MKIKNQSITPLLEVRHFTESDYKSMLAKQDIPAGVVLSEFGYSELLKHPSRYTVQTGMNKHITLSPSYLRYVNHSCDPNVVFDLERMVLRTIRSIQKGEEIVFFYPSTEWAMTEAFDCLCKSEQCLKRIQGAAFLKEEQLENYHLSRHIKAKLAQREEMLAMV